MFAQLVIHFFQKLTMGFANIGHFTLPFHFLIKEDKDDEPICDQGSTDAN